ncbi:hypothetical protein, partial [Mycobacterium szulgai]|uniref:hypothetical protein n=1 Tax=Mycobacterium szulgai TaxID=1787 RepID=UPI0035563D31
MAQPRRAAEPGDDQRTLRGFRRPLRRSDRAQSRMVCDRLIAAFDGYLGAQTGIQGLVHGDYRLDNLLFGTA